MQQADVSVMVRPDVYFMKVLNKLPILSAATRAAAPFCEFERCCMQFYCLVCQGRGLQWSPRCRDVSWNLARRLHEGCTMHVPFFLN
eukprot:s3831_g8.t1